MNGTIDIDTYDRHRHKLREELTIAQMDRHSSELEEMDVEGILALSSPRSLRSSACSRCSFRMEFASTGKGLLKPAQLCRFSTT